MKFLNTLISLFKHKPRKKELVCIISRNSQLWGEKKAGAYKEYNPDTGEVHSFYADFDLWGRFYYDWEVYEKYGEFFVKR